MAVNFPGSPINGQQFTANGITYEWNSTLSLWEISLVTIPADVSELGDSQGLLSGGGSSGEGITAYTNTGDLPMTGVNTGAMAFVTSTNSLYIWNGSTWYGLSVVANSSPSLSGASPSYTLATDGTATVVTLTGTDTDGTPLTYSYSVTSGSLTNGGGETATVTQNGNVFTITPTTTDTYAGTFELTFTVSDGEASATASSSFTLQFAIPQQANTQGNTLLLTTSGSAGDNSSFTDSSPNALTITTAGTPSSQSFSPYRSGGYSVQLDGTSGWIDTGVSDNFGTGDVTFECWVKTTGGGIMLAKYQGGSVMDAFQLSTAGGKMATHTASGTEGEIGTKDLRDNQWHHLVFERYNGTYYYYADGELQGTVANTENAVVGGNWIVGKHGDANIEWYDGQIRDLKLTVGTAVYGGSTPPVPTEPVTIDGSETLVLFTGIPYGKDLSPNNGTVTFNGGVTFVPEGPYDYAVYDSSTHGGSVYLDGNDYLQCANDFSTFFDNPWTIEFWAYLNSLSTSNAISIGDGGGVDGMYLLHGGNGFYLGSNGSWNISAYTSSTITTGQWHHCAVTWDGSDYKIFVNGVLENTATSSAKLGPGPYTIAIGAGYTGTQPTNGYLSDIKMTTSAVYTSEFTPPTEPLSSTNATLHVKGTDANIYDSTQTVKPVTLVGNTTASTAQTKYLSSSMYFDGSGDYLSVGSGSQFDFGTEDFTWEAWAYPNETNRSQIIFSIGDTNSTVASMYYRSTNKFAVWANSTLYLESASTYSTGQWYHVAVVRSGNNFTLYVNGTSVSTSTKTAGIGSSSEGAYVGTNYGLTPSQDWNGYIEDVRITKGLARYTEDFTVPTESLLTYTPPPAAAGSATFENSADGELTFTGDYEFTFSSSGAEATGGASTTAGLENGKKYFEVDLTSISDAAIGLYPVSVTNPGLTVAGGVSIDETTGDIYPGPVDENLTITNTSVLQFAYDATEQKVWLGVDGTWTTATGDPASGAGISTSGTSGETYALTFMSTSGLSSGSATGNIRTSGNLNYTVPTGFTAFADAVTASWYGDRAVVAGGGGSGSNVIEYFNITVTGNSSDFGDLTASKLQFGASGVSNATYGVFGGGGNSYNVPNNVMEYVTISTLGNATDFGDRTINSAFAGSASDATYGLFAGGYTGSSQTNVIDYITIASTGNATDFGELTVSRWGVAGSNDATRGVFSMGNSPDNVIDYVTIASTGNATDFGDLTEARMRGGATGDGTRVVFVGGCLSGANNNPKNTMDYITVQTTGNATDYGDLTNTAANLSCTSNGSRGVRCGGENTSDHDTIDSFTIATTANAAYFGDLSTAKAYLTATSGNAS